MSKDTLRGLVVNQKNKAIRNVSVTSKVSKAVSTDRKGLFLITGETLPDTITLVLPSKKVLQIPVGGLNFAKIMVNDKASYTVKQAEDEITNIGYGSVRKSRSSSGSSSISGDKLRETGESNLIQALVGKIAGVSVAYREDGVMTLRIRGAISIDEKNNGPLYIVDGSIVDNPSLINISDIDRVDVLKDGSPYGVRGAAGVILVSLKK